MGREIRRVPLGWEHPKKEYPDHINHRMREDYQPLYDQDAQSAFEEWQKEYADWLAGEHDRVIKEYGADDYPKDQPYKSFCAWNGQPPDPDYYRPKWSEEQMNGYAVYETVSEGTPVTPTFATKEELIDYLVANGDYWDQRRGDGGWNRANAEQFIGIGFAVSMTFNAATGEIKMPRDGQL